MVCLFCNIMFIFYSITSLSLANTKVTDDGLYHIQGMSISQPLEIIIFCMTSFFALVLNDINGKIDE